MASVAGQIRIDLLAEVAQFNAGMRTASQSLGSFQDQAAKVDRELAKPNKTKENIQKEWSAWNASMKDLRGDVRDKSGFDPRGNSRDMLSWYSMERANATRDIGLHNEVRWKNMVPWGNTARVELSREAALTAAAVAGQGKQIANGFREAMKGIGESAAESYGLGGVFAKVGKFAMGHPLATGAAMAAGYVAKVAYERDAHAREVHESSLQLGQGAEDTSRMMAMGFDPGMLSKFQKSIADKTPEQQAAFSKLRLDPFKLESQPLKQALEEVGASFERYVTNPSERASVAMHLFGKSGASVIATLLEMEETKRRIGGDEIISPGDIERTKNWDHALKELKNSINDISLNIGRTGGTESGAGTAMVRSATAILSHPLEFLKGALILNSGFSDELKEVGLHKRAPHLAAMLDQWAEDDANVRTASTREFLKKKRQERKDRLAAQQRHTDSLSTADKELGYLAMDPDTAARAREREEFQKKIAPNLTSREINDRMNQYDKFVFQQRQKTDFKKLEEDRKKQEEEGRRVYEAVRSPYDKYQDETAKDRDLLRQKVINEEVYAAAARKHLEEYYREAANLDVKQLRESLKTPAQLASERKNWINDLANNGMLSRRDASRLNEEGALDLKKKLGVRDSVADYGKVMREGWEALKNGQITRDEFSQLEKDRRKQALSESGSETKQLQATPGVLVGSREAYTLTMQGLLADKATAQRRDIIDRLDKTLAAIKNIPQPQSQTI